MKNKKSKITAVTTSAPVKHQPVPNGTTDKAVNEYVARFDAFKKKTAEFLVELGNVVYDAKTNLDGKQLEQFCDRVGLRKDSSTFRKMVEVGRKAVRLKPIVEKLPPNWTTLYELATFEDGQFERAADVVVPTSTLKQLKEAAGLQAVSSSSHGFEISLSFAQEPSQKKYYEALDIINEAKKLLGATVHCPKTLEKKFKVIEVNVVREAA
jgi:hypothetical protein